MVETRAPPASLHVPVGVMVEICQRLIERQSLDPSDAGTPETWEETLPNYPALGDVARTSPQIEKVVGPFLYRSVRISISKPIAFVELVRRLTDSPEHAAAVQELVIYNHDGERGDPERDPGLTQAQLDYIFDEAAKAGLQYLPTTDAQRRIEAPWVLIDLMLVRVPNVRKLVLSVMRLPSSRVYADFGTRLPDSVVFKCLKHLVAHAPDGGDPGMSKRALIALFRHTPALVDLEVGLCDRQDCDGLIQSPLPELRRLRLAEAPAVDCAELAKFCPKLERLRVGEDGRAVLILATDSMFRTLDYVRTLDPKQMPASVPLWMAKLDFALARLLQDLLPLAGTLQELDIDWDVMVVTNTESFELLSKFGELRSLRLVFGRWPHGESERLVEALPDTLRSVCLGGQGVRVTEIAQLMRDRMRKGGFPSLRLFEYTPVCQEMDDELPLEVRSILQGTMVESRERPNPPSGWTPWRYVCNDITGRPRR